MNFRDWSSGNLTDVGEVIAGLLVHIGLSLEQIIWFEHGPGAAQSVVGCGLDHAHIHVLVRPPFSFECFEAAAKSSGLLEWRSSENSVDYSLLDQSGSYFIAGGGSRVIAAANVEVAGSQFLRRVVASLIGNEDGWDYRQTPHLANVEATVVNFRDLATRRLNG